MNTSEFSNVFTKIIAILTRGAAAVLLGSEA